MQNGSRVNILLVDDQPNNLLALEALLADLGQNLVRAGSGREALRRVLEQDFALILLDVQMPGMDGFETAALVRERDQSRRTPIIFLTAYEQTQVQQFKGYSLGAVDYLCKPVQPEVLRSKVGVFVELYQKTEEVKHQAELLHERRLAEERQRWEVERLRQEAAREKQVADALAAKAAELAETVRERLRAEERLRERARQQALVADLGQLALGGVELDELLKEAVALVAQTLAVDYCEILELPPGGDTLTFRAGVGWQGGPGGRAAVPAGAGNPWGCALAADEPVIVEDVHADPRFQGPSLPNGHGLVSGVTVAIRGRDRPYGVLGAHARQRRPFTADDGHFLQAVAHVVDAAIQRKRDEGELAAVKDQLALQLEDMTRLHRLSARLSGTLALPPLLEEVLRGVTELLGTDRGVLLLYDPEQTDLYPGAALGLPDGHPGRLPAGPGTLGEAITGPDPLAIEDVDVAPPFAPYREAAGRAGYRGFYSRPLHSRAGAVVGAVAACFREPYRPSDREARLVELYVRQAAEAIDNARLYREIQESNRHKDEFLAMLAHELRNPLAPVLNALSILRMEGDSRPTARHARDILERQVRHMTRLIDDLLDVSRITRGKIELRKERLDLAPVVARAVESTRPFLTTQGHRLDVDLPPEPLLLEADPTRLEQVLSNLLNNAAKYTDPGGHIRLAAGREDGQVVVRVKDNGIGITPELLPRVFDLFMQADESLARSQGGLGIGLTLVNNLVRMHGGSVQAFSEGPGRGSEFVVRLPALAAPAADAPESPETGEPEASATGTAPSGGRPLRVLVVDDNQDAAQSLALLLSMEGHEVRVAHDGPAALDEAGSFRPQVVLLDIGLPGMSGHEVARRLRAQEGARKTVLIAMTGYGQDRDRRQSLEAGFDCHLVKPVHPPELFRLLTGCPA